VIPSRLQKTVNLAFERGIKNRFTRFVARQRRAGAAFRRLLPFYNLLSLYINYFVPSQKLVSKTCDGAHVSRKHDEGFTPYRRIMMDKETPAEIKDRLTETFEKLDVFELRRKIGELQEALRRKAIPTK
jgi:hypothetical protein